MWWIHRDHFKILRISPRRLTKQGIAQGGWGVGRCANSGRRWLKFKTNRNSLNVNFLVATFRPRPTWRRLLRIAMLEKIHNVRTPVQPTRRVSPPTRFIAISGHLKNISPRSGAHASSCFVYPFTKLKTGQRKTKRSLIKKDKTSYCGNYCFSLDYLLSLPKQHSKPRQTREWTSLKQPGNWALRHGSDHGVEKMSKG